MAGAYIIVTKYFAITSKLNKVEASAAVALYTLAFSSILSGMKCVQVRPYSYNGVKISFKIQTKGNQAFLENSLLTHPAI